MDAKRAVVLVSGGLDSATTLAMARSEGFEVYALSVDYGQHHRRELECARQVARALGAVRHTVVTVDLRAVGGSALTDTLDVPKDRSHEDIGQGIPITYVPARNTVLLGLALGYAEVVGAFDIFMGAQLFGLLGLSRLSSGVPRAVRTAGESRHQGWRRRSWHLPRPGTAVAENESGNHP